MKGLFYDSPFTEDVFNDTVKKLEHLNTDAADLYLNEMREAIGEAKRYKHVPAAWPCWRKDLDGTQEYGQCFASPSLSNGKPNPMKTSTLWHNQVGFMKTEERYKQLRVILSAITELNYVQADLNQQNLAVLAPSNFAQVNDVVIFTSNAFYWPKWVPDGHDHAKVGRRFLTAFPNGGTVFETQPPGGELQQWSFP